MLNSGRWLARAVRAQSSSFGSGKFSAKQALRCCSGSKDSSGSRRPTPGSADPPPESARDPAIDDFKEAVKAAAEIISQPSVSAPGKPNIPISADRLTQLFESEMLHLDKQYRLPDPIQAMTQMTQMSEYDAFERARWLADEVPCHFAHRTMLLDRLDAALDKTTKASDPGRQLLKEVRGAYWESFVNLRRNPPSGNWGPQEARLFDESVADLRVRHRILVSMLMEAIHRLKSQLQGPTSLLVETQVASSDEELEQKHVDKILNRFMDEFCRSRVYTEMLTRQYVSLANNQSMLAVGDLHDVIKKAYGDAQGLYDFIFSFFLQ